MASFFSCRSKVDLRKRQTPETKQIVALPLGLSTTITALPVKFCYQWDSQHFQGALFPWEIFVDSPHTGIKCELPTALAIVSIPRYVMLHLPWWFDVGVNLHEKTEHETRTSSKDTHTILSMFFCASPWRPSKFGAILTQTALA